MGTIETQVERCTLCPRLRAYCAEISRVKRNAFKDEDYWGKPVPGFGDPAGKLFVIGLAPAAHGANRTGRMFTGDRSGEWLYRALFRSGFANQPASESKSDGLRLRNAWVTAAARCAPPENKPTGEELELCRPFLERELERADRQRGARVLLSLGGIATLATQRALRSLGWVAPEQKFQKFEHGAITELPATQDHPARVLLYSYHPSQQNTFTGKLTDPMFQSVFEIARARA